MRSLSDASRSLSSQCSISTLKLLRDSVRPAAASSDLRHKSFSLPTRDLRSTATILPDPSSSARRALQSPFGDPYRGALYGRSATYTCIYLEDATMSLL